MGTQHRRNWQKSRKGKVRLWDESNTRFAFERATVDLDLMPCGLLPERRELPPGEGFPGISIIALQEWTEALQGVAGKTHPVHEVRDAIDDYLGSTPELGLDQSRMNLVCYFLKNYINPDPDFVDAKFKEKLARAGDMALSFLARAIAVAK